tara:strand:+ start:3686 stop:4267 length:582 start_codon:yes stop_codon:yes gene_type:complete
MKRTYGYQNHASYTNDDDSHSYRNLDWIEKYFIPTVEAKYKQGGSILDIGCGNGRVWPILGKYFDKIVGIDPFFEYNKIFKNEKVTFESIEFQDYTTLDKFDVLFFNQSFSVFFRSAFVIPNPTSDEIFKKIDELLKDDGEVHFIEWPMGDERNLVDFKDLEWKETLEKYNIYFDLEITPSPETSIIILKRKK